MKIRSYIFKRSFIIIMTSSIWIKVAVGALTGLATVAALGGCVI